MSTDFLSIPVFDEVGQPATLSQLLGKPVVLYFYPKDDTPGCTAEACSFQDAYAQLQKLGVEVVGVSADSAASHQKFKHKYHLSFPLWSDPERALITAFGATASKSLFGKFFAGIQRMTVALDHKGALIHTWNPVKNAAEHPAEVLAFFQQYFDEQSKA